MRRALESLALDSRAAYPSRCSITKHRSIFAAVPIAYSFAFGHSIHTDHAGNSAIHGLVQAPLGAFVLRGEVSIGRANGNRAG